MTAKHTAPLLLLKAALRPLHQVIDSVEPSSRIRKAAHKVVAAIPGLLSNERLCLHFKIDLDGSYAGLGDSLLDLVLARALYETLGSLILDQQSSGRPSHLAQLEESGISSDLRLKELGNLLKANPTRLPTGVCPNTSTKERVCVEIQRELGWNDARKRFLSAGNVYLVGILARQFNVDPSAFFEWKPQGSYVGIHVRGSRHNQERNPSKYLTLKDFHDLNRIFPGREIRIFSDPQPEFLSSLIQEALTQGVNVSMQKSSNFNDVINEILGADFWFQRKGGGTSVPVLYSKMPYIMLSSDLAARQMYGISNRKFGAWSGSNQHFVTSVLHSNLSSLQRVMATYSGPGL